MSAASGDGSVRARLVEAFLATPVMRTGLTRFEPAREPEAERMADAALAALAAVSPAAPTAPGEACRCVGFGDYVLAGDNPHCPACFPSPAPGVIRSAHDSEESP